MLRSFFFISLICSALTVFGQVAQLESSHQEYVIQFSNQQEADSYFNQYPSYITEHKLISKSQHIYKFSLTLEAILPPSDQYLSLQPNAVVEYRAFPNDDLFDSQWNLELIEIQKAWDISTGGVSPNGDTIVIAVLDSGCDVDHADLEKNIWKNKMEIPNDNIDNDDNGYIDDHIGLNLNTGNDRHRADNHGTPVTGIIGAIGNNEEGLTGINWNVKLMILSNVRTVAQIIEAYEYVIDQRNKYERSNGAEGAYVVATNFSAGIANRFPSDFPAWCGMFNALGETGILNVCSTANANSNVDEVGDLPSLCTSPYLITVTNTNQNDEKVIASGFSSTHVDLGAPGENAPSTYSNNQYQNFNGTSSAAPHVSGVIGLIYGATGCDKFATLLSQNKSSAALLAKELILNFTDPLESLNGITVSGGRLNAFKALDGIDQFCNTNTQELLISKLYPNPADQVLNIEYQTPLSNDVNLIIYNSLGQKVYETKLPSAILNTALASVQIGYFSAGTYILTLKSGEVVVNQKFVIIR